MSSALPTEFSASLADSDQELAAALHSLIVEAVPRAQVSVAGSLVSYEVIPGRQIAALARRKDGFRVYVTPIYEHPDLLAQHRSELEPLLVGKSCLRIRRREEIPDEAMRDVLHQGAARE